MGASILQPIDNNSYDQTALLLQKNRFHNKWQYLYIESICNDPQVLEQNYRYKMMYSPDYKDVNTEEVSHLLIIVMLLFA